jgi:3-hydroxyisobutyrate dehydrogenase-like beta-hydroxyacid dehydrogenase
MNVGILHPGEMGVSVAATMNNSGHTVYWISSARSAQTRQRAEVQGLLDAGSLEKMVELCPVIVSVCPPASAESVANDALALGFSGQYIDANAISPQRAESIGRAMSDGGADFVDGGIIGGPAWKPGSTWLYLSGPTATEAAALFAAGPLETRVIGDAIGKASALKMCFAAYTKGTTALLSAVLATAEGLNVRAELEQQWGAEFAEDAARRTQQVTAKAWRFVGEMDEIAATFAAAGTPDGFHRAAGDLYQRMAEFKGASPLPQLEEVLRAVLNGAARRLP